MIRPACFLVLSAFCSAAVADEVFEIWVDLELDGDGKVTRAEPLAEMPAQVASALRNAIDGWTFKDGGGEWSGLPSSSAVLVKLRSIDNTNGATTLEFERLYEGPRPIKVAPVPLEANLTPQQDETIKIAFLVGKNGLAKKFRVIKRGSRREYERAVIESLRLWRFEPRRVQGKKISSPVDDFPVVIRAD